MVIISKMFEERLDQVYELLSDSSSGKLVLPNPEISVSTTGKTHFSNVKAILKMINRPPDHFIKFLSDELGDPVSQKTNSLSDGLVIKGRVVKDTINNVVKKYTTEFVLCRNCSSYKTRFIKNQKLRTYSIQCKQCNSSFTI